MRADRRKPTLLYLAILVGIVVGCGSPSSTEPERTPAGVNLPTEEPLSGAAPASEDVDTAVSSTITPLPTPTPNPSPEPSPTVILATSLESIVGTWRGTKAHGVYQRFNDDGTCRVANTLETLDTPPNVECVYHFEGTLLYHETVKNNDFAQCNDPVGVYEVQLLGRDEILFKRVREYSDSCIPRARSMLQEHERIP